MTVTDLKGTTEGLKESGAITETHELSYRFRLRRWSTFTNLRLKESLLEVSNDDGQTLRQIELGSIRNFHEYDDIATSDPETGSFASKLCGIKVRYGRGLLIRNGSYIGNKSNGTGFFGQLITNQQAEYELFLDALKQRVAAIHPNTRIHRGWLIVALLGIGIMGVGLLMMSAPFFELFYYKQTWWDAFPLIFVGFPLGALASFAGFCFAATYWPRSQSLAEYLRSKDTRGDP